MGKYEKEVRAIYNVRQNWHKTNQHTSVRHQFRLEIRSYLTILRVGFQKSQHVAQKNNPFYGGTREFYEGSCMILSYPGK